ncbi:YagK/YfjJ domain-containing protein [Vibrio tapetis]|uniref:YagK/YfjJ C-terminal domain-containing protein n=1 Tax=Vibrio tapetis subsp. tapetis TaxID=1671868 RepID=A0A2N8ZET1_9VIBR|nr:inovirus-type Gp2 protein [Vibrio tapetis]SON50412.1 conserved protein of unknown function [Vibrio tapetis subsp. tapetis]
MYQIALHESKKHLAYLNYCGEEQLIFYPQAGVIKKILVKSYKQLDTMMSCYSKVSVVFLQIHQKEFTEDNKQMALFIKRFQQRLSKIYPCRFAYIWVREQASAQSQHYHLAIMLSGHLCQSTRGIDLLCKDVWEQINPLNFSFKVRNRIYRIHRTDKQHELRAARLRLSYLAKIHSKTDFSSYTKSFGTSRLTYNNGYR